MAIDDPYQYVCDYYQDYIITLKKDKRNNGIVDLLRVGYANSCIWGSGQFNAHFSRATMDNSVLKIGLL